MTAQWRRSCSLRALYLTAKAPLSCRSALAAPLWGVRQAACSPYIAVAQPGSTRCGA